MTETSPKPLCGCTPSKVFVNAHHLDTDGVDSAICLYPAAVQAHDDIAKLQAETLRLKRKRTRQLLEAKALIVDLLKDSAWPHNPVHEKAEEFLKVLDA